MRINEGPAALSWICFCLGAAFAFPRWYGEMESDPLMLHALVPVAMIALLIGALYGSQKKFEYDFGGMVRWLGMLGAVALSCISVRWDLDHYHGFVWSVLFDFPVPAIAWGWQVILWRQGQA